MNNLLSMVSALDTQSGLGRMKTQGQDFSRAYAEFVFFRDFAMSNPMTAQKWMALNRLSIAVHKTVGAANSKIDAVNNIAQAMFGYSVLSLLPEVSNMYLMSGNAALAYTIQELNAFNAALNRLEIQQHEAAQNAENQANPQ